MSVKAAIVAKLQQDILAMQGCPSIRSHAANGSDLGRMADSFPNGTFPFAAVHEFLVGNSEEASATTGFIAGLLQPVMRNNGVAIWIGTSRKIFPPALKAFGINPQDLIFLYVKNEKEVNAVIGEALACNSLAAVVGEMKELGFTASRRFQLAVEKSAVPCFVLRNSLKNLPTVAVTRWRIKPHQSKLEDGLPGVGHPSWNVELLKVRGGKPGRWDLEWREGRFRYPSKFAVISGEQQKKTG